MNLRTSLIAVIDRRRTCKVLADPQHPIEYPPAVLQVNDEIVIESIATAGLAPFHYDRGCDGIPEPWRVHFLGVETCRRIAVDLAHWFELKPSNKLPSMLSACGCLVLVNWLPQFRNIGAADISPPPTDNLEFNADKKIEIDDEHLAATAAMVQNLLLLLTAAELGTYWSSGGQLGSSEMFQRLGIPIDQRLLAAVFVEYPNGKGSVMERISGKNHAQRTVACRWLTKRSIN